MRHGKKVNHLGRKSAHRKAMLANMACSLIEHKRINTTVAKAKALKQFIEPLITKSKAENNQTTEKGTHNRRIAFKNLRDKYAVTELFGSVSDKVGTRPGGYTRIIKLGNRLGDNADMAMIELVDYNEIYNAGKTAKKKTTRRSRRGKKADQTVVEKATESVVEEAVEEVTEEIKETEAAATEEATQEVEEVKEPKATEEEVSEPEATEPEDSESEEKKNDSEA
ncbi:MAG: 50S ribosomal protein L17 [Eudoraea sp.]|nr:50S ribosomal protein L17 [Eudoraea sp.]MBT8292108.1 50S ribosomal protein L17 [Eudoraea sp.]NNL01911.1 50S ribosomal protein L17 [Eudoraea sp.]